MIKTRSILLSVPFAAVIMLFSAANVFACSCGERPTVYESFVSAENVIVAKVTSITKVAPVDEDKYGPINNIKSVTMSVERTFKGGLKDQQQIEFTQGGGGDCLWTYDDDSPGREYLLYIGEPSRGHPWSDEVPKTGPSATFDNSLLDQVL